MLGFDLGNSAASAAASLKPGDGVLSKPLRAENSAASAAASLKHKAWRSHLSLRCQKFRGICRGLIEAIQTNSKEACGISTKFRGICRGLIEAGVGWTRD